MALSKIHAFNKLRSVLRLIAPSLLLPLTGLDDHPVMVVVGGHAGKVLAHPVAVPGRQVIEPHGAVWRLRHRPRGEADAAGATAVAPAGGTLRGHGAVLYHSSLKRTPRQPMS